MVQYTLAIPTNSSMCIPEKKLCEFKIICYLILRASFSYHLPKNSHNSITFYLLRYIWETSLKCHFIFSKIEKCYTNLSLVAKLKYSSAQLWHVRVP